MRAEQFIKDHGLEKAREVVEGAPDEWADVYLDALDEYTFIAVPPTDTDDFVSISDIKRIVESIDIVNRACGAERVIELHNRYKDSPVGHKYWLGVRVDRMNQAIADYESIYGGSHES